MKTILVSALTAATLALAGCNSTSTQRDAMEMVDDGTTATRVKTALAAAEIDSLLDIEIEAYRGQVQLNGFVDSQESIDTAVATAENVNGVTKVINNLTVKPAQ